MFVPSEPFIILGEGTSSIVYGTLPSNIENQTYGDLIYAIKAFRTDYGGYFFSEATILSDLDHPNIIKLIAIDMNKLYLTFKPMMGIKQAYKEGLISFDEIIDGLVEALKYLESKNVVHGDIKPSNIFYDFREHRVVLGDFGSTRTPPVVDFSDTTYEYRSPEILFGNKENQFNGDIWALGVSLYEILYDEQFIDIPSNKSRININVRCMDEIARRMNWYPSTWRKSFQGLPDYSQLLVMGWDPNEKSILDTVDLKYKPIFEFCLNDNWTKRLSISKYQY